MTSDTYSSGRTHAVPVATSVCLEFYFSLIEAKIRNRRIAQLGRAPRPNTGEVVGSNPAPPTIA
jgi:hypothetical protein